MPGVDLVHDSDVPLSDLWAPLVDIERYPDYISDVLTAEIVSRDGDRRVSTWTVLFKGSTMSWTEEEILDHGRARLSFHQIEGDLADYSGYYQLTPVGTGTRVHVHVEFDIGLPEMAEMLDPIAAAAMRENLTSIIAHVENRAAGAPPQLGDAG